VPRNARLDHPVELVELQESDTEGRWRDHPGTLGAGRRDRPAATDHHRPQQRLAERRHARAARARPAASAATASAHRDVHGHDRALVALGEQVDRQVVEHATVDEQPTVVVGQRRQQHGQVRRGVGRIRDRPASVHLTGAGDQVGAHRVQLAGKALEDRVAERAGEALAHPPATRQRLHRQDSTREAGTCAGCVPARDHPPPPVLPSAVPLMECGTR